MSFPTALLGSFSWAGLSAPWPVGSTVSWLQDLSAAHQHSSHSHPPTLLCSQCYPCWLLQQGESGCRANGVSGSTLLPYDLTKRKEKGFLKAGCFLQGGEGVSSGGRVAERKDRSQGACDVRNYWSDFLLPFPQTGPFNPLGTISVWINWYF